RQQQHGADRGGQRDHDRRHEAAARERQPRRLVAARRSGATAGDDDDDDDEQRHRVAESLQVLPVDEVGHLALVALGLALQDADQERTGDRQRERREAADEGGGERRQDQADGERAGGEADDRGEEDGRGGGEDARQREVRELDGRGGQTARGGDAPVLGDSGRREAERRLGVDEPQAHGEQDGEADDPDAVGR